MALPTLASGQFVCGRSGGQVRSGPPVAVVRRLAGRLAGALAGLPAVISAGLGGGGGGLGGLACASPCGSRGQSQSRRREGEGGRVALPYCAAARPAHGSRPAAHPSSSHPSLERGPACSSTEGTSSCSSSSTPTHYALRTRASARPTLGRSCEGELRRAQTQLLLCLTVGLAARAQTRRDALRSASATLCHSRCTRPPAFRAPSGCR